MKKFFGVFVAFILLVEDLILLDSELTPVRIGFGIGASVLAAATVLYYSFKKEEGFK